MTELDVKKTKFRRIERKRLSCFKCFLLFIVIWHVVKSILPVILVQICQRKNEPICDLDVTSNSPCVDRSLKLINWLMFADIVLASSVMIWAIWVAFSL